MINRYYAFAGIIYYPAGGMDDFLMSSNDFEDCVEACKEYYNKGCAHSEVWTSIWNMEDHFEVAVVEDQIIIYNSDKQIVSRHDYEWTTVE